MQVSTVSSFEFLFEEELSAVKRTGRILLESEQNTCAAPSQLEMVTMWQ